eukprot:EC814133.1.p2 GENE.EC814133.1~~EC814133.1.p2  ORF type:complete len:134 (+),score=36.73 EC814133.1:47-448(+)
MVVIRLKSKQGMSRLELDDEMTIAELQQLISDRCHVPVRKQRLSFAKERPAKHELTDTKITIGMLDLQPGAFLFMDYDGNVAPPEAALAPPPAARPEPRAAPRPAARPAPSYGGRGNGSNQMSMADLGCDSGA